MAPQNIALIEDTLVRQFAGGSGTTSCGLAGSIVVGAAICRQYHPGV
jgi:hypothetical protein